MGFIGRLFGIGRTEVTPAPKADVRSPVRPSMATPIQTLILELVLWTKWFHECYWEHEEKTSGEKRLDDLPTLLEVAAFQLFVLRAISLNCAHQYNDANDELFMAGVDSIVPRFAALGSSSDIRALLRHRGEVYSRYAAEQREAAVASLFMSDMSPLFTYLRMARDGHIAPPSSKPPPLTFEDPMGMMGRADARNELYTTYVAPFIMVLRASLAGDVDFRRLPVPEVEARIARALDAASKRQLGRGV